MSMTEIAIERYVETDAIPALNAGLRAAFSCMSGMSVRSSAYNPLVTVFADNPTPADENGIRQTVLTWDTSQRTPEQDAAATLAAALVAFESDLATLRAGLSEVYAVHDCAALVQSLCDMVGTLYKALPQ